MKCPNPNCKHDADNHEINGGCFVDKCYCSASYVNICDLEIKSLKALLAKAKEVTTKLASLVTNHPDGHMKEFQEAQSEASAFLMKLEEK